MIYLPSTIYHPGQFVEESGLYRVLHFKHRQDDKDVMLTAGEHFPHCLICDDIVFYLPSEASTTADKQAA